MVSCGDGLLRTPDSSSQLQLLCTIMNRKSDDSSPELLPTGELLEPMDMELEARKQQQYLSEAEHEREAVSVKIGYGEVDDNGNIKFSWQRLLVFAGVFF